MDIVDVVEKFRAGIGSKLGIRVELEPAAVVSGDPAIIIRHNPPAQRVSRVSDDGSVLIWYRDISLTLYLVATGSGDKKFRKAMAKLSQPLAALFDNDDGGGDIPLDDTGTWYAAYMGTVRPGDRLLRNEELEGSFDWNEAWDVRLYVPESAFA